MLLTNCLLCSASDNRSEGSRVALPGSYVEQMPYPCYKNDRFTTAMLFVLPLAMIFAWLFPIAMMIRGIVREKEVSLPESPASCRSVCYPLPFSPPPLPSPPLTQTRLREFMKMMGLSDAVLRTSWFLTSGVVLLVSIIWITILLKVGVILPFSDWLLIFFYLLLYAVSMIAYRYIHIRVHRWCVYSHCIMFPLYALLSVCVSPSVPPSLH